VLSDTAHDASRVRPHVRWYREIRRAQLAGDEGTYKVLQAGLEAVQQRNEANKAAALDRLESYARQHCLNVPVGLMLTEPVVVRLQTRPSRRLPHHARCAPLPKL
jgi:hypothetical protein